MQAAEEGRDRPAAPLVTAKEFTAEPLHAVTERDESRQAVGLTDEWSVVRHGERVDFGERRQFVAVERPFPEPESGTGHQQEECQGNDGCGRLTAMVRSSVTEG